MNIFTVVKFKKGISVNLKRLQVHKKTGKNHDDSSRYYNFIKFTLKELTISPLFFK